MNKFEHIRLKFTSDEPMKYGANAAAEFDDRDWPRFVRITDIAAGGQLYEETFRSLPPDVAAPYKLKSGDILLARSGATVGKSFIYDESWGDACYAGYLLRLRTSKHFSERFVYWYLQSTKYWADIDSNLIQSTIQNVSADRYGNFRIPVPPLETQQRIAHFLDEKTARIDALIEKKRALLDRLAEKRQALITRAVTKGLDPDAPLKPSGIEWLGEIPAHWEIKRFRFTARLISGATPTTTNSEYWDGDIPWISPKDVKKEELTTSQDKVTEFAINDYGLRIHENDNAVIVIRGMILARHVPVAVARGRYTINQDMKVIRSQGELQPEFIQMYLYAIESFLFTLIAESGHGTKALRTDVLSDIPVLLPPSQEQDRIIDSLNERKSEIDRAMASIEKSINKLSEYRSALITAAVTGQIPNLT